MDYLFLWLLTKHVLVLSGHAKKLSYIFVLRSTANWVLIEIQKVNLGGVCSTQPFLSQFTFVVSAKYLLSITLKKIP